MSYNENSRYNFLGSYIQNAMGEKEERCLLALLLSMILSGGATLRTECSPTANDYEAPARRNQLNSSEQLTSLIE
jgi:hypothetical protein